MPVRTERNSWRWKRWVRKLSKKLVVASMPVYDCPCLAAALYDEGRPLEFSVTPVQERGCWAIFM